MYGDFASNVRYQLEILASLDAIVYVCDVENYRVLYASPYAQKVLGVRQGDKCFEGIYGNDQVCSFCSDQDLLDEQGQPTGLFTVKGITRKLVAGLNAVRELLSSAVDRWFV